MAGTRRHSLRRSNHLASMMWGLRDGRESHFKAPRQSIICSIDGVPSLLYNRYIRAFQIFLDENTSFRYAVAGLKSGCIVVQYNAIDYDRSLEPTVLKELEHSIEDVDLWGEFKIKSLMAFNKKIVLKRGEENGVREYL